jgi:predicted glycogen debranching enzyme
MAKDVRVVYPGPAGGAPAPDELLAREWLVTNGLGGYASGTIAGIPTRRYHGLLIAALPAPLGRVVMLNDLRERVGPTGDAPGVDLRETGWLEEFRLESGLPVWRYAVAGAVVEKRVLVLHGQNTVHVSYRVLTASGPVTLTLMPAVDFRPHEAPVSHPLARPYAMTIVDDRYELAAAGGFPPLRLRFYGELAHFAVDGRVVGEMLYPVEANRGYDASGELWSPGHFRVVLAPGREATLVASCESWESIRALEPVAARASEGERRRRLLAAAHPAARTGPAAELTLAADAFIITPVGRAMHAARARAAGDEVRTIIAGYHWFTDWGRDTMITLEGLTLVTGRHVEAGYILRTFGDYVRDGLIPNMFPEGESEGLYHTADASLWFFHAIDRYLAATGDRATLRLLLPKLVDIVDHHLTGTHFGIGVDARDGLLRQGAVGYQLTWMDAKVGDWVVTPRRGKAVEINALWYNALRLLEGWLREEQGEPAAKPLAEHAERAQAAFNQRFWYEAGGYCYDVVDGEGADDAALRPNQLLAISLAHPVLAPARWPSVVRVVGDRLLTSFGLRSLDPRHPDYKSKYYGDLRARDAAYHQGTVWAWPIGPFVDAWLRVHPGERAAARRMLEAFVPHLGESGAGSISEIFDAEPPYTPRGCIAQAWSVAEVLRAWVKTEPG